MSIPEKPGKEADTNWEQVPTLKMPKKKGFLRKIGEWAGVVEKDQSVYFVNQSGINLHVWLLNDQNRRVIQQKRHLQGAQIGINGGFGARYGMERTYERNGQDLTQFMPVGATKTSRNTFYLPKEESQGYFMICYGDDHHGGKEDGVLRIMLVVKGATVTFKPTHLPGKSPSFLRPSDYVWSPSSIPDESRKPGHKPLQKLQGAQNHDLLSEDLSGDAEQEDEHHDSGRLRDQSEDHFLALKQACESDDITPEEFQLHFAPRLQPLRECLSERRKLSKSSTVDVASQGLVDPLDGLSGSERQQVLAEQHAIFEQAALQKQQSESKAYGNKQDCGTSEPAQKLPLQEKILRKKNEISKQAGFSQPRAGVDEYKHQDKDKKGGLATASHQRSDPVPDMCHPIRQKIGGRPKAEQAGFSNGPAKASGGTVEDQPIWFARKFSQ
mmetsp:Transcript_41079/g.64153  ORF Transcript_41079/g.64153 Transcript_41079/m.64153 type:complete len:440 (+) Transcript_41079:272-1591(+)